MSVRDFSAFETSLKAAPVPVPSHREVLVSVFAAVARGDFEALHHCLTDDIELRIHGFPPFNGLWKGIQDVVPAITANFAKITEQVPEIESMIQQDATIALVLRETGRLIEDDQAYRIRGVMWFEFEAAKVKRIEEFLHSV
jgi:ketosteroid isomerase-like protein